MYLENRIPVMETQNNEFMTWDYVKDRIFLFVRRKKIDNTLKTTLYNLDLCLKVYLESDPQPDTPYYVVQREMIDMFDVSEQIIWQTAKKNTEKKLSLKSFADFFGVAFSSTTMYYATTDYAYDGACALAFPELFRSFCIAHGESSCYMLPSSTMEVIVLPGSFVGGSCGVQNLAEMVNTVNEAEVLPEQQLDPVVYVYKVLDNSVRIVAAYRGEAAS